MIQKKCIKIVQIFKNHNINENETLLFQINNFFLFYSLFQFIDKKIKKDNLNEKMYMKILIAYFYYLLKCLVINSKEIIINEENIINLKNFLQQQQDNDLILYFVQEYYDMTVISDYNLDTYVNTNISFIGNKNGTTFDFKNKYKSAIYFIFNDERKKYEIKMENIIFDNYEYQGGYTNCVRCITLSSKIKDFSFILNNCTFKNGMTSYISIQYDFNVEGSSEPQVQFNNCTFM